MEKCIKCLEEKSTDNFYKNNRKSNGLSSFCKPCHNKIGRERYQKYKQDILFKHKEWKIRNLDKNKKINWNYSLIKRYGITAEKHQSILEEQGFVCAICGAEKPGLHYTHFHTDHDHLSGEVRGLLCNDCNLLLGHAKDSVEILKSAVEYLNGTSASTKLS